MTIEKGRPWGVPGPLPADGVIVRSDAEARAAVGAARERREPPPVLGLLGGDLCRTLGGTGDEARLRSDAAMTFPVDLGEVIADGRWYCFVAHLVARNRLWTRVTAALNAQWIGSWNAGPRAHPDDGLLDVYEARLRLADLPEVRSRLRTGAHLPHPEIHEQRVAHAELATPGLTLWLDGERVGRADHLMVRIEPDALTVVV